MSGGRTTSIDEAFSRLDTFRAEMRQSVEQAVTSEKMIERQMNLNRDMAENWRKRFEEKTTRGDEKLAAVAQQQQQHHISVITNFEADLKNSREYTNRSTKLINQLDQVAERFRVLHLLLSPIPALRQTRCLEYTELVDDLCRLFQSCSENQKDDLASALKPIEERLEKLEAETIIAYDGVPAAELEAIVDNVINEKTQMEEDRRRNQQMVQTWESRVQMASEIGENAIAEPAEARKLTYQVRVSNLDKSLKLLTAISAMLEKKLKSKSQ